MDSIILSEKEEKEKTIKAIMIDHVKRWVMIDGHQKIINEKSKKLRDMKHDSSEYICRYMSENKINNNKIPITDGELRIYDKKEYSPITFGYIEKCLAELIPDKSQVDYIIDYIKEKREITISQDIRRTTTKNKSLKSIE